MGASRRVLIIGAVAAVTVTAVVAALLIGGGDGADPRKLWAAAAEPICDQAATARAKLVLPADLADTGSVHTWAAAMSDLLSGLGDDLGRIEPGSEEAAALAQQFTSEVERRAELYHGVANGTIAAPDWDPGTPDELGTALESGTYAKAVDALEPWGAPTCVDVISVLGGDAESPRAAWISDTEGACLDAQRNYAKIDDRSGTTESYLSKIADTTSELTDALGSVGTPPDAALQDAYTEMLDQLGLLEEAARSGNIAGARDANTQWMLIAERAGLPGCSQGVTASSDNPSNLLSAATPTATGVGVGAGGIDDAQVVAGYTVSQLVANARPDPANAYGTRDLVSGIIGGGVTGVTGGDNASPKRVSISERRLHNPDAAVSDTNPWIVGVAVADSAGRCMWSQLFGDSTLYGYTPPQPATGPCTGDAAAGAYQP